MAEFNRVLEAGLKLFNYRTKDSNGYVQTANLIKVFTFYNNKFKNYSEFDKFDMWSDILQKWYISYLRKLAKPRGRMSLRRVKKPVFEERYQWAYDNLVKDLRYIISLIGKSKFCFIRGDVAYVYLKNIYDLDYMRFYDSIKQEYRFVLMDVKKIKVGYFKRQYPQSWYESRYFETPDHPYRIDIPYNPLVHSYHSGFRILED